MIKKGITEGKNFFLNEAKIELLHLLMIQLDYPNYRKC